MARTTGFLSVHNTASRTLLHRDRCCCCTWVELSLSQLVRASTSNQPDKVEKKGSICLPPQMRNWDMERWSEMPKLIQETCGRATNWTRLGTAEDKDWSEITAQTFLTHQEEKKGKKKCHHKNPELHQGGFFHCVLRPGTRNTVCCPCD